MLGGEIILPDDGEHLREPQRMKSVIPAGSGSLGGKALMPLAAPEQVADLRHLPPTPVLHGHAALADKLSRGFLNHRPQPKAVCGVTLPLPVQPRLGLIIGEGVFIGVHNQRVLQYFAQGGEVRLPHFPQDKAFRL